VRLFVVGRKRGKRVKKKANDVNTFTHLFYFLLPFFSSQISPEKAIFMFVKNVLPPTGESFVFDLKESSSFVSLTFSFLSPQPKQLSAALMSDVYDEHKDIDGFLYMTFSGENTFGGEEEALLSLMTTSE